MEAQWEHDRVPQMYQESYVLPRPIRCTCGRVLPWEAYDELLRDPARNPRSKLDIPGIVRLCCKKGLLTSRETVVHTQPLPPGATSIPPAKGRRRIEVL